MFENFLSNLNLDSPFMKKEEWSITKDGSGQNIVTFQSFIGMEVIDGGKSVDNPVEKGSFATYNKVDSPLEAKVELAFQGSDEKIKGAISKLQNLRKKTEIIALTTPVVTYSSLTLEEFSYSVRTDNGRGVLFVELSLKEVLQVEAEYTDAKLAPQKDCGKVQAKAVDKQKSPQTGSSKPKAKAERQSMLYGIMH